MIDREVKEVNGEAATHGKMAQQPRTTRRKSETVQLHKGETTAQHGLAKQTENKLIQNADI